MSESDFDIGARKGHWDKYPEVFKPRGVFDQAAKELFLQHYMKTGRLYESASAANVCQETVRRHERENIDGFAEQFAIAKGIFREHIEGEIQRRAIEGVDEPIIGGRNRDEIIGTVRRYSDPLLMMLAKRHIPEYREKQQVDLNVSGGVMAIPVAPPQVDWEKQFSELTVPDAEIVNGDS